MTWNELLKAVSNGTMPKVKRGNTIGIVTTIKHIGKYKGCAVNFGYNWDDWFHAETQSDKRSKYMEELELIAYMPRVVCYCGSLRFKKLFERYEYKSVFKGEIALLPCCMFVDIEREYGALSDYKQKADEQHKRKIEICDEVFVLNINGYIGESTRSEIDYALKIGKPVKYMVPEH